jgi:predicted nucleic acid-binding protein
VRRDPADNPILRAALACGADYLVTNDRHLLELDPYEGLSIVSMQRYVRLLNDLR